MTATRDRRRDPRSKASALEEWGQRSVFGTAKGWPWWAAVVLALGLSIIGAFIDMNTSGNLGRVYEGAYFLGCVAAVCLVRRRNVFGPMVQAPLILAVTIPIVVLMTKGLPATGGTMSKLITLGVPLVTGFPTMAITTGATVLIGGIRYLIQRKPAGVDGDDENRADDHSDRRRRPSERDGDRGRQRPGNAPSRSAEGRSSRDDGDAPRDRSRTPQQNRSRSEPPSRESRSASGRSTSSRSSQDRAGGRDRDPGRDPRQSRDRGQAPRSGQSRDRGSQPPPRGGRASGDDGRRQTPRRRDDDR